MQMPESTPEENITGSSGISIDNILDAAMVNYSVQDKVQQEFFQQENPVSDDSYTVKARETTPYVPEKDPVDEFLEKTPSGIFPLAQIELPKPADGAVPLKREDHLNFGGLEAAHTCLDFAEHPSFAGNWPTEVLGIWSNSYILCNSNSGMVIVDQHAAHERILFEKIINAAKEGSKSSQLLLIPQSLCLRGSEHRLIFRNREVFEKLGFEFEDAGGTTILISAIPADLAPVCRPVEEMIPDMLEELLVKQNNSSLAVDLDAAARAACHNAIRANDHLTLQEAANLIEEMKKCNQGTMCPHGRPTMITITKIELEKRFKRR